MGKRTGFTLVEVLAVIIILAIILAITVPSISNIIDRANKSAFKNSVLMVFNQGRLYQLRNNVGSGKTLAELGLASIGNLGNNGVIKEENSVLLTSSPAITNGKYCVSKDTSKNDLLNNQISDARIYACKTNPGPGEIACDICDKDTTGPENVVATIGTVTSKSIEVIGSATDAESGIASYAFSKDNGAVWTEPQPSNIYVFNDLSNGTYQIKVRVYNSIGMTTDSAVVNQSTVSIIIPTYSVDVSGWAKSKIVTIDYQTADYEKQYSIDGGDTWIFSLSQTQDVNFNTNGNVIARVTDGINVVTSSTYNVTQIDNSAPDSATATMGMVTSSSIQVIGSGTDIESGIAQYAFSKDDGSTWTPAQTSATYTFADLTTGTYQIKVKVYNGSGMTLNSSTLSQLTTGISTPTYSISTTDWATSKTVTIDYQTTVYTKQYSIDGGNTWNNSSSQTKDITFNANGSVIARVTDGVNTVTSSTYNVTQIDTTAPTSATATIGTITSSSIQVTGSGADTESGITQYAFSKDNGSTWTSVQPGATYTFTNLATGTYQIKVKVYNAADLTLISNVVSQLTTGISIPTYSISPSSGWATSKTVTIDYQTASYIKQYSIDGGSTWITSSNSTQDVIFNAAGSIIARVSDGINTVTSSTYNVTQIDTTAPTGLSVGIGTVTTNSIQVTANGIDSESGIANYQFSNDNGSSWTTIQASNTYTFSNLTTGTYQIKVKLVNNVGLSTISGATSQATVSLNTPTYSISPSSGWAISKTVTIDYQTSNYTKQYSIDGGSVWVTSSNPTQDVVFNANGSVIARVTDGVNTVTSSTFNVTQIDTTAPTSPTVSLGGYTSGTWTNGSITQTFTSTDGGSGILKYQYSANGTSGWTDVPSNPWTISANVNTNRYIRAIDNVGNISGNSTMYTVRIDTTVPTINVTSPTTGTYSTSLSLQGTVNDANVGDIITAKYRIDSGTIQTVSGTVTSNGSNQLFATTSVDLTGISGGSHILYVWSQDTAGNTSTTVNISFTKQTLYSYNKYNVNTGYYNYRNPTWTSAFGNTTAGKAGSGYSSYSFDSSSGFYNSGSVKTLSGSGDSYWHSGGSYTNRYTVIGEYDASTWLLSIYHGDCSYDTNYSQGSLVQSGIVAPDGTYPNNGRHSDGYWYVKGGAV